MASFRNHVRERFFNRFASRVCQGEHYSVSRSIITQPIREQKVWDWIGWYKTFVRQHAWQDVRQKYPVYMPIYISSSSIPFYNFVCPDSSPIIHVFHMSFSVAEMVEPPSEGWLSLADWRILSFTELCWLKSILYNFICCFGTKQHSKINTHLHIIIVHINTLIIYQYTQSTWHENCFNNKIQIDMRWLIYFHKYTYLVITYTSVSISIYIQKHRFIYILWITRHRINAYKCIHTYTKQAYCYNYIWHKYILYIQYMTEKLDHNILTECTQTQHTFIDSSQIHLQPQLDYAYICVG